MEAGHSWKLQEMLITFQQEALFCDTVLMTSDGGKVYAHSAVLAAVCPALLSVLNQHPLTIPRPNIVDLSLFDTLVVTDFVEFIYTGKYEKSKHQTAVRELLETVGVLLSDADLMKTTNQGTSSDVKLVLRNGNKSGKSCDDQVELCLTQYNEEYSTNTDTVVLSTINSLNSLKPISKRRGRPPRAVRETSDNLQNLPKVGLSSRAVEPSSITTGLDNTENEISDLLSSQSTDMLLYGSNKNQLSKQSVKISNRKKVKLLVEDSEVIAIKEEIDSLKEDAVAICSHDSDALASMMRDNFACTFCDLTFLSARKLDRHKWSHYQREDGMYVCKTCGKVHEHRDRLRKHVRLHEVGYKRFMCTVCGHRVQNLTRLKSHMNTHTNARPNVCEVCGLCFNDIEYLTKHMRHHTGDKRYECRFCHKRFIRNDSKRKHERTHTGERPYQCQTCLTRFTSSIGLKYHMFQHSGERPHRCTECQKAFRSTTRLRQHIRSVHLDNSEKPCRCTVCDKAFAINSHLKQHMLIHTDHGLGNKRTKKTSARLKSVLAEGSNSIEENDVGVTLELDSRLNQQDLMLDSNASDDAHDCS